MDEPKKPKHAAVWTDDCQGKKDFDAHLVSLSTRYWPRGGGFSVLDSRTGHWEHNEQRPEIEPSANAKIILRLPDDEHLVFASAEFRGDTEDEVKARVEAWAEEQFDRVVTALTYEFGAPYTED
jgi:hypothetical protein